MVPIMLRSMGVAKSDGRAERGGRGSGEGGGIVPGALCDARGWEAEAWPLACCCIMSAENGEPGKGMSMCSPPCADGVACTSITNCSTNSSMPGLITLFCVHNQERQHGCYRRMTHVSTAGHSQHTCFTTCKGYPVF